MALKFNIPDLRVSDAARARIAEIAAELIEEMNRAGISGDGTPFPKGKTRDIDMHDTGRLHSDYRATSEGLSYNAPQAEALQRKYNWCGIPSSGVWRDRFEAKVKTIIEADLRDRFSRR